MMTLRTPLRYPGGKRKLANFIDLLITSNNLKGCDYAEPFTGGAGLAIELLRRGVVRHVYLNDIDPNVYMFWDSVLNRTEDLCKLIQDTPVTMSEWYRQKELLSSNDPLIHGFATFFLNRTNRSGIIWGGVIGGKSQTGKWKIDCRFNKSDLIGKIMSIGSAREFISFNNEDAEDFIEKIHEKFNKNSLIYLDPPYYVKGVGLYENHYKHEDHKKLALRVLDLSTPWVVSYDNHPNIRDMYPVEQKIEYSIHYSAQDHVRGHEVIFCGNCNFPNGVTPLQKG